MCVFCSNASAFTRSSYFRQYILHVCLFSIRVLLLLTPYMYIVHINNFVFTFFSNINNVSLWPMGVETQKLNIECIVRVLNLTWVCFQDHIIYLTLFSWECVYEIISATLQFCLYLISFSFLYRFPRTRWTTTFLSSWPWR